MARLPQKIDEEDDWYFPEPTDFPGTSDRPAIPPGLADAMDRLSPSQGRPMAPDLPLGTAYSPKRNKYRLPSGEEIEAGDFRPLPLDRNMLDPQEFMSQRRRTIIEDV